MTNKNLDAKTVESFGDEWKRYNQSSISKSELKRIFDDYFHIFPKEFCIMRVNALTWGAAQADGPNLLHLR